MKPKAPKAAKRWCIVTPSGRLVDDYKTRGDARMYSLEQDRVLLYDLTPASVSLDREERDAGQEQCEACGEWRSSVLMYSCDEGVYLCEKCYEGAKLPLHRGKARAAALREAADIASRFARGDYSEPMQIAAQLREMAEAKPGA